MAALLNRARMSTATTGTGTITLGSAVTGYFTFAEAGAVNATVYSYCIEDGDDFEIGVGTYTSSGTTFSRDTVTASKISGTAGTSKINLSGNAEIFITARATDLSSGVLTTQGDILYRDASGLARLAKGTAFQHLRQNSALTAPEWATDRETLTGNRTYYVRTDGSDSNDGLADTSGGAFLTINKAIDVACGLDLSVYSITIQVGNGTYTATILPKSYIGAGPIIIQGDTTTPSNVTITPASGDGLSAIGVIGVWRITGFKFTNSNAGGDHFFLEGSTLEFSAIDFGSCAASGRHIWAWQNAVVRAVGNYSITGGAACHLFLLLNALCYIATRTVTLTGTPAFSAQFIASYSGATAQMNGNTYSGSATGQRYSANSNSVIDTSGGGATYFPGNSVGATATGGEYL